MEICFNYSSLHLSNRTLHFLSGFATVKPRFLCLLAFGAETISIVHRCQIVSYSNVVPRYYSFTFLSLLSLWSAKGQVHQESDTFFMYSPYFLGAARAELPSLNVKSSKEACENSACPSRCLSRHFDCTPRSLELTRICYSTESTVSSSFGSFSSVLFGVWRRFCLRKNGRRASPHSCWIVRCFAFFCSCAANSCLLLKKQPVARRCLQFVPWPVRL